MLVTFMSALFLIMPFNAVMVVPAFEADISNKTTYILKTANISTEVEKDVILGRGLKHYQQGQYIEAQNIFQSLLKSYPDSPTLLFNLGLTYYQLEHYGFAIGLWRRALDQNPYFVKATQALNFAEKQRSTQRSSSQISWQEQIRKWILVYISWDICLFLMAIFGFYFLWSKIKYLASCSFALKRGESRPAVSTQLIVLGLFFVLTVAIALMKVKDHTTLRATIISPKVSVYVSPSQETASLFELLEGSDVIIKQMNEHWVQVSYLNRQIGWIQKEHIFHYAGERLW